MDFGEFSECEVFGRASAKQYREAIRIDPKQAKAHNILGLAMATKGDEGGAIASYRELLPILGERGEQDAIAVANRPRGPVRIRPSSPPPATIASWFGTSQAVNWLQRLAASLSPGQPIYSVGGGGHFMPDGAYSGFYSCKGTPRTGRDLLKAALCQAEAKNTPPKVIPKPKPPEAAGIP